MNDRVENPYVGTRTFSEEDAPRYFGRERESRDLLALVAFEQVVVFYAQSGTGKSSLVNTKLIPGLEKDNRFEVLTPSRVTGEVPLDAAVENVYVYNLMQNLANHTLDPVTLVGMRLKDFLPKLVRDATLARRSFKFLAADNMQRSRRRVLIIDQFEELFTTHPEEWEGRADFFEQLAEALEADPNLWVVLVMREDYIAYLDPYAHIMPGGLRVRYYMQKMDYEDASKAVKKPAENAGRPYEEGAAEQLVEDLRGRQLRRRAGKKQMILGQYVEPIVLQAVCSTLWENLDSDDQDITVVDLKKLGNVNKALGKYYEKRVHEVAIMNEVKKLGIRESEIRNWIGSKLITSDGRRNIVVRKEGGKSEGLDDSVIQFFSNKKDLIREEGHGAASIYELTHDRLAEPILENNVVWEREHGFPFHPQVILWSESRGRAKEAHLLGEMALEEAEKWILKNPDQLSTLESEFLEASRAKKQEDANQRARELEQQEREREIQKQKLEAAEKLASEQARFAQQQAEANLRIRKALRTSTIIAGIASLLLVLTIALGIQSNRNQRTIQRRVLIDASSIEYQNDKKLGAMLAYQALKQFGDHGVVEQGVANIFYDMNDRLPVQSPFIIPSTINTVTSIAFNPADGGQTLAAGYADGAIVLFDMSTQSPIGEPFTDHTANVASLSFSPDGKILASASWDNTIILWDMETKQPAAEPLRGHTYQVNSLAFSPDGKTLASGGGDNQIILWNMETRRVETNQPISQLLRGHTYPVSSVVFSPDGETLASGSFDGSIMLWEVGTGENIGTLIDTSIISALAFSPNGNTLASGGNTYGAPISLWDVAKQERIGDPFVDFNYVYSLAFSTDGETLASGGYNSISFWNITTHERLGDPIYHFNNNVTGLAFSPDGTSLAGSSSGDSDIVLWDIDSRDVKATITAPIQKDKISVSALAISSDGEIQGITSTKLMLWNGGDQPPVSVVVDPFSAVQPMESIYHLDTITNQIYALSPDGSYRVVVVPAIAQVIDTSTQETVSQVNHGFNSAVSAVAFSQEGEYVASAAYDNQVRIWDPKSGRVIAQIYSDLDAVPISLSFSPDGSRIVIAYNDPKNTVEVWDIATRQKIMIIANRQFLPLEYLAGSSVGQDDAKESTSEEQGEQLGNPVADVAYLETGLFILYHNGILDHWDIWPSRADLEAEALSICEPCELTPTQREEYGLFTWPMRVQDYAGYLFTFIIVLVYGFGARRVYSHAIKNPNPVDQNAKPGFTLKKFLSAVGQGTALILIGILVWGTLGLMERIVYAEQARRPSDAIAVFLLFLLPLGLWAGGTYAHVTRGQSGRLARGIRVFIGMLAGVLAGALAELLGITSLGYLTNELESIFSDMELFWMILVVSGLAGGIMSFIGSCVYIFLLQPRSEGSKITRQGQTLLQLLFGVGLFFEERKTIRRWIYPLAVLVMIGFWLLVPPIDLDFSYFGGDIMLDGTAGGIGLIGFIVYLCGLYDLRRSMKSVDPSLPSKLETRLQSWWKRGLITLGFGFVSGLLILYLDQAYIDWETISIMAMISLVLGIFGLLFFPHRTSYILVAFLVVVGTIAWFTVFDSFFPALYFGLGSAIIVGAIISRVLHAMKKI